MNFFFNESARIEHLEHVAYYEGCQRGLGSRYLEAFDESLGHAGSKLKNASSLKTTGISIFLHKSHRKPKPKQF